MLPPATSLQLNASGQTKTRVYWDISQQAPLAAADPQAKPEA